MKLLLMFHDTFGDVGFVAFSGGSLPSLCSGPQTCRPLHSVVLGFALGSSRFPSVFPRFPRCFGSRIARRMRAVRGLCFLAPFFSSLTAWIVSGEERVELQPSRSESRETDTTKRLQVCCCVPCLLPRLSILQGTFHVSP